MFHGGYWGPHVGYYDGVNDDCGYGGSGFQAGLWEGGHFAYNQSANAYLTKLTASNNARVASGGSLQGKRAGELADPTAHDCRPPQQSCSDPPGSIKSGTMCNS